MARVVFAFRYALVVVVSCCVEAPRPRPLASSAPVARAETHAPLVEPATRETPQGDAPQPSYTPSPLAAPDSAPCTPVRDCRIVARHPLASSFARRHGFTPSASGLVAGPRGWETHGSPEHTRFVQVSSSCEAEGDFYIESEGQIWLRFGDTWDPIEGADARRFRPLGVGFYDDGAQVFDRAESLSDMDPAVDRATFHTCVRPSERARSRRFYPDAVDALGLFGRGEHGDLERVRE